MTNGKCFSFKQGFITLVVCLPCISFAAENDGYSVSFYGYVKHAQAKPSTHEGNMSYFSVAKSKRTAKVDLESGIGTYIDSYHQRSYMIFSNVTSPRIKTKYFQPAIGLNCSLKGSSYSSEEKRWICSPPLKLRIGKSKGLYAYVTPVPKLGKLTNGLVSLEVGYKF